jgi:hypothetical protein
MNINSTNIKQNGKSPLILIELTEHKKDHDICCRNPVTGLGHAQNCGGMKPINVIPTLSS